MTGRKVTVKAGQEWVNAADGRRVRITDVLGSMALVADVETWEIDNIDVLWFNRPDKGWTFVKE